MNHQTIHDQNSTAHQRMKGLKALERAKEIEAAKMQGGAKYIRIDDRTEILKNENTSKKGTTKSNTHTTSPRAEKRFGGKG